MHDHVVIPGHALSNTIHLQQSVQVASLIATHPGGVKLTASVPAEVVVHGGLHLPEGSSFGKHIALMTLPNANAHRYVHPKVKGGGAKPSATSGAGPRSCAFYTLVPNPTNPSCNGQSNGIASVLEPTDGVGPYAYQWVGGPATRQWVGVGAGTYTVIVFDLGQGGAPCNIDVFVNEPGPLVLFSMSTTPPTCFGACDGTAFPVVIGGNGGYTYSWSNGGTGFSNSNLCTSFSFTVTDALGCTLTTNFTFTNEPAQLSLSGAVTNIECGGANDGAITTTTSGGTGTANVTWTGPNGYSNTGDAISGLAPGTYTATATDQNGCTTSQNFTITEIPGMQVVPTATHNSCAGLSEGSISLAISGGTAPYSVSWAGPNGYSATGATINGLAAGTYTATITDGLGCELSQQTDVTEPPAIVITAAATDVLCHGDANGTATATATGGTGTLNYTWTGPNTFTAAGPNISNLAPGDYTVTATDATNCSIAATATVSEPDELHASLAVTPLACTGGNTGAIDLTATGGTGAYTFAWTGPGGFNSTAQNLSNLAAGTYNVVVTDANGCTTLGSANVTLSTGIQLSASVTHTTCATGNTGAIALAVSGGATPYTFAWSGPGGFNSTSQNITGLAAGTYQVVVTDADGCSTNGSYTVNSPAPLNATFSITNATCFGVPTGAINTTVSGGTAPYTFLWIGPAGFIGTTQNISNALGGDYTLMLTDANGCSRFIDTAIGQPTQININRVITNVTCFGGSNGAITLTVNGGTPGYTFAWSGPNGFTATTQNISGRPAGTYTVTVTDQNGCTRSMTYTINQPVQIVLNGNVTNVLCAGVNNGAITITVASGAGPFTWSWSGPGGFTANTQNISNLAGGTYNVTATNGQGCQGTGIFTVSANTTITFSPTINQISCNGAADGAISVTLNGGTAPYTTNWTGPGGFASSSLTINNLNAGSYNLSVNDANGCLATASYTITEAPALDAGFTFSDISCHNSNDGAATVNPQGGTPPYSVAWTGPNGFTSSSLSLSNLSEGTYAVLITDATGCTATGSATLTNPAALVLATTSVRPTCTANNGSITAQVSGGTVSGDYTYQWTNQGGATVSTAAQATGLGPGIYTLLVVDDNGCTASATVQLTVNTFNVSAALNNISCGGANDGSVTVNIAGGTPPYQFSWTGPNGFTANTQSISNLEAGFYLLTVTDDTNCTGNFPYDIEEPVALTISTNITTETCVGSNDGSISTTASGGTPGYQYAWSGPNGFTGNGQGINGLEAGTYTLQLTDALGCVESFDIELLPATAVTASISVTDIACAGVHSGTAQASAAGGTGVYSFSWTGPDGFTATGAALSNLGPGTYELTATDGNGCNAQAQATIEQPDTLLAQLTSTPSACGQALGTAEATATGGTAPLTFTWFDGALQPIGNGASIGALSSGFYTLQVSDANGCTVAIPFTITDSDGQINATITAPTCPGGADGSITASVQGGTAPYSFVWSGPNGFAATTDVITALASGSYQLTVTDANGCLFPGIFNVTDPAGMTQGAIITHVSCQGNDGAISLSIGGGLAPYTILWTGPNGYSGTGANIAALELGTYTFTATDQNGCVLVESHDVEPIADPVATATIVNALCGEANTGAISLAVSDGTQPYTFAWSGPDGFTADTENIANLSGGVYQLTITDARGCTFGESYTVQQPAPIAINAQLTLPQCGVNNGAIAANPTGGTAPLGYFIAWTDAQSNALGFGPSLSNLGVGVYVVTVSDVHGCTADSTITLTNPGINVVATAGNVLCHGEATGTLSLAVQGAAEPFTVSWSGPNGFANTGTDLSDLSAGLYQYTLTDADGCTAAGAVAIDEPALLTAAILAAGTCFGVEEGSLSANVNGGVAPHTLAWSGPDGYAANGPAIANLASGAYTLDITDLNGCALTLHATLEENPEITASVDVVHLACHGTGDGSIALTVSGGTPGYDVNWTGDAGFSATGTDLSGLEAGTYTALIADAVGCTLIISVDVVAPTPLETIIDVLPLGCVQNGDAGAITLTPVGGTSPYTIVWSGPEGLASTSFALSNLMAGSYSYELTDAQGCTLSGNVELDEAVPTEATLIAQAVSCHSDTDGAIATTIQSGLSPYTFAWTGPDGFVATTADIDGLAAGTYQLIITDSLGCTTGFTAEVTEPGPLIAEATATDATCNTSSDGSIALTIAGGTAPFEVEWTLVDGTTTFGESLNALTPGTYQAVVTDANGCQTELETDLGYVLEIAAYAGDDLALCRSALPWNLNGTGLNTDQFIWTNLEGDTLAKTSTLPLTALAPGLYTFVLEAGNGLCTTTDTMDVEVLPLPAVFAGPDVTVFAEQPFTLGGNPTATSGVALVWAPQAGSNFDTTSPNPTGTLLLTTDFVVLATDANGCTATDTVRVTVIPDITISNGFTPNGDGVNDQWVIDNMELFPNNVVSVYNRWGVAIFRAAPYVNGSAWDGTYEGKPLPVGTYYYTIELNDNRFPRPITGPITIHR